MTDSASIRIHKFIANNTVISRREAEKLITSGHVKINNIEAIVGQKINPDKDIVMVKNQKIKITEQEITIAVNKEKDCNVARINKEKGIIVSKKDPQKRKTIYDALPPKYTSLVHIGRLDKNSEGLILLTTNGELCYRLTHPKYEIEKEYLVDISGTPGKQSLLEIENGIEIDGIYLKPKSIEIINETKSNTSQLKFILTEGKKREIRKIVKYLGFTVIKLQRVRLGNIYIQHLGQNKLLELNNKQILELKRAVNL